MRIFPVFIILILVGAAGTAALLAAYHFPLTMGTPSPVQPIAFSHKIHAGAHEINCLFCHRYAEISKVAGVPEVDTCRICHVIIGRDKPEIKRVMAYWKDKEPIPWVKVHDLPDHVYFPHKTHVNAGVLCTTCHGEVASMDRIKRVSSLKMGWCLNCHKEKDVSVDCWTCHI